jgi:hypothetical protein
MMDIFRRATKKRDEEAEAGTPKPAVATASSPAMTQAEFTRKGPVETEEAKIKKAQKLAELLRNR